MMAITMRAAECVRLFEATLPTTANDVMRQELENQVFRFNLWATNNLVFAPTRASMDWRLRNAPLLESAMVEILDDLQSNLIKLGAMVKNPVCQEDGTNPFDAVGKELEGLFRLSRASRRSGILRRFVKVSSYVEYDESGVNLTDEFRKAAERIIEYRLQHSTASRTLRDRILDSICLRQQHFAYLRARWEKSGRLKEDPSTHPSLPPRPSFGATFSVTGSMASSASKANRRNKPTKLPVRGSSIFTATTAQYERVRKLPSVKSERSAQQDVIFDEDDIPLPPRIPPQAVEYECPFCFLVCPVEDFSGVRWKKHIIQDIMPYVCILESCPSPHALFESGKDWTTHMRNQHVVSGWTCMDGGHETTLFIDSDSAFKDHMHQEHSGEFPEEELDDLAAACYHRLPLDDLVSECPFCPEGQSQNFHGTEMINHVAGHLLSLAQISIAGHMDGDGGQSDKAESSLHRPSASRSEGSIAERLRTEFPFADEIEVDPVYPSYSAPIEIPDGNESSCHELWVVVREALQLPPLHSPAPSEKPMDEIRADEEGEPNSEDSEITGEEKAPDDKHGQPTSNSGPKYVARESFGIVTGVTSVIGDYGGYLGYLGNPSDIEWIVKEGDEIPRNAYLQHQFTHPIEGNVVAGRHSVTWRNDIVSSLSPRDQLPRSLDDGNATTWRSLNSMMSIDDLYRLGSRVEASGEPGSRIPEYWTVDVELRTQLTGYGVSLELWCGDLQIGRTAGILPSHGSVIADNPRYEFTDEGQYQLEKLELGVEGIGNELLAEGVSPTLEEPPGTHEGRHIEEATENSISNDLLPDSTRLEQMEASGDVPLSRKLKKKKEKKKTKAITLEPEGAALVSETNDRAESDRPLSPATVEETPISEVPPLSSSRDTTVSGSTTKRYNCGWNGCEEAYSTLDSLNAHVMMKSHGPTQTQEEFDEARKEKRTYNRAARAALAAVMRERHRTFLPAREHERQRAAAAQAAKTSQIDVPNPADPEQKAQPATFEPPADDDDIDIEKGPDTERYPQMTLISMQLEYYFSVDNLCKDLYLRKHMDTQGFVPLIFIAGFKRMQSLTDDYELIRQVCIQIQLKNVEYYVGEDGVDRLRVRDNWAQWVLPFDLRDPSAQHDGPGPQPGSMAGNSSSGSISLNSGTAHGRSLSF